MADFDQEKFMSEPCEDTFYDLKKDELVISQSGYRNSTYSLFLLQLDLIAPPKTTTVSHKSRVTWIA